MFTPLCCCFPGALWSGSVGVMQLLQSQQVAGVWMQWKTGESVWDGIDKRNTGIYTPPHLFGFCSLWQSLPSLVHLCLYAKMIKSVMITFLGILCFFLFLFCEDSFRASEDLISILVIAGAFDNLFFSSLDYSFSVLFVSSFWQLHPQFWIILDFYC